MYQNQESIESSMGMDRREALKRTALMLGIALSPKMLSAVAEEASPVGLQSLNSGQYAVLEGLVDTLLPRTDSVGGLDVKVPQFVDLVFSKFETPEKRKNFRKGLDAFEADCRSLHGKGFSDSSKKDRLAVYRKWAAGNGKQKAFLTLSREWILLGYYSSEEVSKNVLKFNPIPGAYRGCIDLSETDGVAWAI